MRLHARDTLLCSFGPTGTMLTDEYGWGMDGCRWMDGVRIEQAQRVAAVDEKKKVRVPLCENAASARKACLEPLNAKHQLVNP